MKKITIVGSGVVGKATGVGFAQKGNEVTFLDIDQKRVLSLREEGYKAYAVPEINPETFESDINIFTVPTPTIDGRINLDYLIQAARDLGKRLKHAKNYQLVVTRSTMVPGTTRDIVIKEIEEYSGKKAGIDFGVCMNPEYLREEKAVEDFANPWIIVIGQFDQKSGDIMEELYADFECEKHRVSLEEAEIQKYIHNLYNAVKISFFNEFRQITKSMSLDSNKVMNLVARSCEGMWNPLYGTKDRGPYGRSCLPKDTKAFYIWAKEKGFDMKVLKATMDVNNEMLDELVKDKEAFYTWANNNGLDIKTLEEIVGGDKTILEKLSV